jgi:ketosteroid isomerase-like protein
MATKEGIRTAEEEGNVKAYRAALDAFNRDGAEALFEFLDPDIELYDPDLPDGGVYRRHEGVRRFLDQILEGFEVIEVRDYELIPAGDQVVGLIHTYGRGSRGGIEVEVRDAHTWTFRDGKVVHWRLYLDRKEALADAGLDGG